jgi:hypothetical protein
MKKLLFNLSALCCSIILLFSSCSKENNLSGNVSNSFQAQSDFKSLIYQDVREEAGVLVFKDEIKYVNTLRIIDSLRFNTLPKFSNDFYNLDEAIENHSNGTRESKIAEELMVNLIPYSHRLLLNLRGEVIIGDNIVIYQKGKKYIIPTNDKHKLELIHANKCDDCKPVEATSMTEKQLNTRGAADQMHENLTFGNTFQLGNKTLRFNQGVAIWIEYFAGQFGSTNGGYRVTTNVHIDLLVRQSNGQFTEESSIARNLSFNISGFVNHKNMVDLGPPPGFLVKDLRRNFAFNSNNFPWIQNLNNLNKGHIWITLDELNVSAYQSTKSFKSMLSNNGYIVQYRVEGFVKQFIVSNSGLVLQSTNNPFSIWERI